MLHPIMIFLKSSFSLLNNHVDTTLGGDQAGAVPFPGHRLLCFRAHGVQVS